MTAIDDYRTIVGDRRIDQLRTLAAPLAGRRVVHVNSTRQGGGVAELLGWMVPLLQSLGLDCRWEIIEGPAEFSRVTKGFHNAIQGMPVALDDDDLELHREVNRANARTLDLDADVVVVHDPQPAYLPVFTPRDRVGRWIWRCHIDAARPDPLVWRHLEAALTAYQATVFSMPAFARPLPIPAWLIAPAIDPQSPKNCPIGDAERLQTLVRFGIDPERPLLLQVSRFDRFKDPLGVLAAYRMVKPHRPGVQLVLAGGPADDDPEGPEIFRRVHEAAADDPDVKVLMLAPDAHRTINALQRSATIVLQKSLREGFGLTVTEALWKGVPVIGGATGGITLQVHDHHTGFLVHSSAGAAFRIRWLLRHREARERMGSAGSDYVREHFLLIRQMREFLQMLRCLEQPGSLPLVA